MIDNDHCARMGEYNLWMNRRLYEACRSLSDAQRKSDQGAFFGSVHRTLNHILYGDLAFMNRFTDASVPQLVLGADLYDDFEVLAGVRTSWDTRIVEWARTLTPQWLATDATYVSQVDGVERTIARWILVTHMFNHQTHHRGQITTLLSQMNVDMGSTDLPFMPDL